jgi:hypothetical protein
VSELHESTSLNSAHIFKTHSIALKDSRNIAVCFDSQVMVLWMVHLITNFEKL